MLNMTELMHVKLICLKLVNMKYKKITEMDQYNSYSEIHEKLAMKDYEGNRDELELIEIIIDEYESREINYHREMNPVELLEYILKEEGLSKSQIARELKVSRQLITDIIMYRRNISKIMVIKLAKRFNMRPIAFGREYKLKNRRTRNRMASV